MDIFEKLAENTFVGFSGKAALHGYMKRDEDEIDQDAKQRHMDRKKRIKKNVVPQIKKTLEEGKFSHLEDKSNNPRTPHSDAVNTNVNAKDIPIREF